MCVCVYICRCVCIYICIHICILTYMFLYINDFHFLHCQCLLKYLAALPLTVIRMDPFWDKTEQKSVRTSTLPAIVVSGDSNLHKYSADLREMVCYNTIQETLFRTLWKYITTRKSSPKSTNSQILLLQCILNKSAGMFDFCFYKFQVYNYLTASKTQQK